MQLCAMSWKLPGNARRNYPCKRLEFLQVARTGYFALVNIKSGLRWTIPLRKASAMDQELKVSLPLFFKQDPEGEAVVVRRTAHQRLVPHVGRRRTGGGRGVHF